MSEGGKDDRGLFQTVGEELAATRTAQKLDVADIARRTRIPARHIEAIESGDYATLPALPYSAGFVKTYANLLGLDGQAMSRAFRDQVGDIERGAFEPEAYEPADPSRVPSRLLAMIGLGVALLLGMAYLLLRFEGDNRDLAKLAADTPEEIMPALRPKPAVVPPPVPVQPAIPTGPIAIMATEDAWIQVSQADGPKLFRDVLKAGDKFVVPDTAVDPVLRTGRPQSIKVMIGETALPSIGEPDHLVRAYSLKRDALLAILAPAASALTPPGTGAIGDASDPTASASGSAPVAATAAADEAGAPPPRHLRRHRGLRRHDAADGAAGPDSANTPPPQP
jgi:transcriptional regulator with XRE-family HTH domain